MSKKCSLIIKKTLLAKLFLEYTVVQMSPLKEIPQVKVHRCRIRTAMAQLMCWRLKCLKKFHMADKHWTCVNSFHPAGYIFCGYSKKSSVVHVVCFRIDRSGSSCTDWLTRFKFFFVNNNLGRLGSFSVEPVFPNFLFITIFVKFVFTQCAIYSLETLQSF